MASVQVSLGYRKLDEILVDELGWRRLSTRTGRLLPEGRLRPVARSSGRTAYLCEVDPGDGLPDAVARRTARDGLEESSPGALLIFTDFLCRREIWQWVDESDGIGILREVSRRPAEDDGHELVARLRESGRNRRRRRAARARQADDEAERIRAAVLRLLMAASAGAAHAPVDGEPSEVAADAASHRLERLIRVAGESQLRLLWRTLRRLSLLDPACGGGDRLLCAHGILTTLYDAVLERMSAYVTDRNSEGLRPRTRSLPDFRRVLEGLPANGEMRRATLAAWVIANNLFGADASPAAVRRCRARLGRTLSGAFPGTHALLRLNIRVGELELDRDPLRARLGAGFRRGDPNSLAAERAVIDRSVRLIRGLATAGEAVEWSNAVGQIEHRLRAIERALATHPQHEPGAPAGHKKSRIGSESAPPRVNLWIGFPGRERRGRFDIVLGNAGRDVIHQDGRSYARRSASSPTTWAREEPMVYPREGRLDGRGAASGNPLQVFAVSRLVERDSGEYPKGVITALGAAAPEALHLCGDARNLAPPLVGLFCSGRTPPDLVLPAIEIVRAMCFAGSPAVGGFHTPVEKEWLRQLLDAGSRVVLCRARGLAQRRLPKAWDAAIRAGTLTLVSSFDDGVRRPTLQSAGQRNELVGALATAVFVAHASPAGMTYQLARSLVDRGVPVFTLEHPSNHDLLRIGAEVIRSGEELVSRAVV